MDDDIGRTQAPGGLDGLLLALQDVGILIGLAGVGRHGRVDLADHQPGVRGNAAQVLEVALEVGLGTGEQLPVHGILEHAEVHGVEADGSYAPQPFRVAVGAAHGIGGGGNLHARSLLTFRSG